ncbi:hypothetical protein H0V99_02320 [Candidatus Saccharibacteria bacterium]|nr:hypothetical protein [Candidatus Saccharibacteria bacterium]
MNEKLQRVAFAGAVLFTGCSSNENLQPSQSTAVESTTTLFPVNTLLETATVLETSTTASMPGVVNPECVVEILPGNSLFSVFNKTGISIVSLQTENRIQDPDKIQPGYLDICIDEMDDISGGQRLPATTTTSTTTALTTTTTVHTTTIPETTITPAPETTTTVTLPPETAVPVTEAPKSLPTGVKAQQEKANTLFAGYGMPELSVDGIAGPKTDQKICASRLLLNMPATRADMVPGSEEERLFMSSESLLIPSTAATKAAKWMLIDQTCQVTVLGESDTKVAFIFPSSSGTVEFPSRNGEWAAFRYDPALANGGWHNSSDYPADVDSLLNGNMKWPVYHHKGQATHGALNVPTYPASHGCNRLSEANQEILINWLGLVGIQEEIWSISRIGLTVTVQGAYEGE